MRRVMFIAGAIVLALYVPLCLSNIATAEEAKPFLGVRFEPAAEDQSVLLEPDRIRVVSVIAGGSAEKAGLKSNDVIVRVNGAPVRSQEEFLKVIARHKVGSSAVLSMIRDGVPLEKTVFFQTRDGDSLVPKQPVLRIELGTNTGRIDHIATDRQGRWVVTASDDKTARLYEVATGRLLRTFRPPIGDDAEGILRSVAISPDGAITAVAGVTGPTWDGRLSIYLFDTSSGNLLRRISGISGIGVQYLAFSPDGSILVASLGGKNGIRLFRSADGAEIGRDTAFEERSNSVDFSADGRHIVSSGADGYIRLYEMVGTQGPTPLRMIAKGRTSGGKLPYIVRFSPNGLKVAVGYVDTPRVDVFDATDLNLLYSAETGDLKKGNLAAVAWSADGRTLYAAGEHMDRALQAPIRRWQNEGKGSAEDIQIGAIDTIQDLVALPDGGLLAVGNALFQLKLNGESQIFAKPPRADHRNTINFNLSSDGSEVCFGYVRRDVSTACFDLSARHLFPFSERGAERTLHKPIHTHNTLHLKGRLHTAELTLNGAPLKFAQYEVARSLAIAADGSRFLLGTNGPLRLISKSGKQLWRSLGHGNAWEVNVAQNGRVAVAAYDDGTIRWYRMNDGKELLAFFPHADRKRWVIWTPSGYYDASPGGEEFIGWHVNNGKDHAADFFPASKFRATYYRPDVITKILDTLDESEAVQLANAESGRKEVKAVDNLLPPVVSIIGPADGATVDSSSITFRYTLRTPVDAPVTALRVMIDGRPISTGRGLTIVPKDRGVQTITVTIPERDCEISIIAENRHASSVSATVRLSWAGKTRGEFTIQPKLYLLAVGVSAYKDKELTLKYAAKDARDYAAAVQKQKGGLYREVTVKLLTDAEATKDDILDGLDWLRKETTAKDVAMIFLAGHGVNDQNGIYYYLPQNANPDRLLRSGVAFSDIKNTLASLAGKALLFVDTCHSGNVMGGRRGVADINAFINELSSAENGVIVFASSTGRQYSLENDKWSNGAFTKALVEGISGKADYGGKGRITINMLDLYLSERVKELTGGQQTPTTTKPQTIQDFPLAVKR